MILFCLESFGDEWLILIYKKQSDEVVHRFFVALIDVHYEAVNNRLQLLGAFLERLDEKKHDGEKMTSLETSWEKRQDDKGGW